METDCIFCKIAAGKLGTEFLYESDEIVAFRDIHPKAPTHILIIPRRHIPRITDLQESDEKLVGRMVTVANTLAEKEGLKESGFRLIFNCGRDSGQEVFHIHLHLLGGRPFHWPPG
ncbi:MAG TPA: histidine triad nucleotide-binding protein [Candidatus Marinimicrobia bacterium]|nr:histidine triad nucleotide-binding protein [Candidatus Neomarinimicrobiota bacterium]HQH56625.1 histidine triad nucleotide-binding protein [Candidatus Neomarinimicrobiota bacterium]HRS90556.1 histidine triad nucleotide-binding protein [Candidatus Neomarinimicrobiota bacterium]HRU45807.1 histidine triad nucleotide-binding protein [Candidatus Neomarinimicrobiota bacterium]